ncbi:MAG: arginine--tRNA ligase [Chlamydiia bacterium]|nr:arginine--tRNA ligase [Chlamydiia bacterium]
MIVETLSQVIEQAVKAAFVDFQPATLDLTQSTQEKFGHYQFNSAMKWAKELKMAPRAIAEAIVSKLQAPMLEKVEVAGPGFINLTLSKEYVSQKVNDPQLGLKRPEHPKRVIVEFSSPNTAKEMHVGHLRSTIIGDSLARILEFLGHDVVRLNHVGDWGTQFGMLIAYMQEEKPKVLSQEEQTDLTHLTEWYRAAKLKFDADPDFKKRAQEKVVALQSGQPAEKAAWNLICAISRQAYDQIYEMLDIRIDERGESFYNPMLPEVIDELDKKGLITLSEGAKCVFLEGFTNREGNPLPLMVQKSDGGYNYDTTDMAAIRHRIIDEKADWLIYITDAGQSLHFNMIFQAAQKAGWYDPTQVRIDHVPFGVVLGADGKKFRTRSGETEKLIDLLNTAIAHAEKILIDRSPDMPEAERQSLAHTLGLSAIKYADLSNHRLSDYVFSYDKMLRFEGNTAAFLMYSYVRVNGIKRKVGIDPETLTDPIVLDHPSEVALGLHLLRFPEALNAAAEELLPHRLTDYLFTLAEKFNAFFRDCRVAGSPEQNSRLRLAETTASTLRHGLNLLGIHTVNKM